MTQKSQKPDEPEDRSIHSDHINEVHNVPMAILKRPIPSELDEEKVASLMEAIKVKTGPFFLINHFDQIIPSSSCCHFGQSIELDSSY